VARIRTIKPEAFVHEGLFDLERATKLPIRWAFAGLWCHADRRGRFEWRPRRLKPGILPHDSLDFSRVLDALATRGFVVKYACQQVEYGWIPSFQRHQVINNRESESSFPPHPQDPDQSTTWTRDARVSDACPTPLVQDEAEGKGREGKGTEQEGKGTVALARVGADDFEAFWIAYPGPRRKAKADALKAWTQTAALRPPLSDLLAALEAQRGTPDWIKDGGQYIPMPSSWLRGHRWLDSTELQPNVSAATARMIAGSRTASFGDFPDPFKAPA
jgi:hypothetical protein